VTIFRYSLVWLVNQVCEMCHITVHMIEQPPDPECRIDIE